jgi:DNA-binding GntR family transcriptional regulator
VIADALRKAITLGELKAGTPLRQDHLALEFGVSHIPVREALKALVAEGLAVFVKNRGVIVSELSADVAWQLTEYRCLLEPQMARWAVPDLTREDFEAAKSILDRLDKENSGAALLSLNTEFHSIILRRANRPFFLRSIEAVRANLGRYWRLAWEDLRYKPHSQKDHRRILMLCRKRDADAVAIEMERHIRDTGTAVVAYIKRQAEKT